ncbi:MAG TPA: multiheme c-type cytochrome [bacterium]|jgi:nitrate/TMAO reductase-like tetraheme cytochrome c subunit
MEEKSDPGSNSMKKLFIPVTLALVVLLLIIATLMPTKRRDILGSGERDRLYVEEFGRSHPRMPLDNTMICYNCHTTVYGDWKNTAHYNTASDPVFKSAYNYVMAQSNGETGVACLNCHAPQVTDRIANEDLQSLLKSEPEMSSVNCVVCHSSSAALSFGWVGDVADEDAADELPAQRTAEFCMNCHSPENNHLRNFGMPESGGTEFFSSPSAEYLESGYASENGLTCLDCHGQTGRGTLHGWSSDDYRLLKSAYEIGPFNFFESESAAFSNPDDISVRWLGGINIENTGSAHSLPAGGLNRMLQVKLMVYQDEDNILAEGLSTFSISPGMIDGRIPPGKSLPAIIELDPEQYVEFLVIRDNLTLGYEIYYGYETELGEWLGSTMGIENELVLIDSGSIPYSVLIGESPSAADEDHSE